MEKKCTKCGEVKSLDEFSNDKSKKDGKQSRCKDCVKLYAKINKEHIKKRQQEYRKINLEKMIKWREKNKENIINYSKKYRKENKESIKEYNKKYRKENRESIKKREQKYREKNKEIIKEKSKIYEKNRDKEKRRKAKKIYREKNRERLREYSNNWSREKLKTDSLFKLRSSIRTNIGNSLIKRGYTKENKTYNMLKCDYNFFMEWINGIASNGHQYGFGDLHLDHVIPISLAETEDELYLLNHYSNFQLLSADENLSKGNRYVNPTNLKRVLEHHPEPNKIKEIYSRL